MPLSTTAAATRIAFAAIVAAAAVGVPAEEHFSGEEDGVADVAEEGYADSAFVVGAGDHDLE